MSRLKAVAELGADSNWPPELIALYEQRFVDLVRVGYLITGNRGVAEDLTQDAFLAAVPLMVEVDKPYAYVRAAVVNRARSWHRRQRIERVKRPDPPDPVVNEPDEMWDALERLDARQRTAIVLRYYENMPDREIALILECARPTVRTLVRRGLKQLRREIDQ